jgi:hypothetical protein
LKSFVWSGYDCGLYIYLIVNNFYFVFLQGERFYDGCEQQCQCMGYGDMVCLSRCPPTAPAPGQNCYTLPDASDPCCNITVCDKPVPDPDQNVPKEEISKEAKQPRVINEQELTEAFPGGLNVNL